MYDEDDDENDEDVKDGCHEFDDMMRLAKILAASCYVCAWPWEKMITITI
jgi:hypothetical protein